MMLLRGLVQTDHTWNCIVVLPKRGEGTLMDTSALKEFRY